MALFELLASPRKTANSVRPSSTGEIARLSAQEAMASRSSRHQASSAAHSDTMAIVPGRNRSRSRCAQSVARLSSTAPVFRLGKSRLVLSKTGAPSSTTLHPTYRRFAANPNASGPRFEVAGSGMQALDGLTFLHVRLHLLSVKSLVQREHCRTERIAREGA